MMDDLPDELIMIILNNLILLDNGITDFKNFSLISKKYHIYWDDDQLWRKICHKYLGSNFTPNNYGLNKWSDFFKTRKYFLTNERKVYNSISKILSKYINDIDYFQTQLDEIITNNKYTTLIYQKHYCILEKYQIKNFDKIKSKLFNLLISQLNNNLNLLIKIDQLYYWSPIALKDLITQFPKIFYSKESTSLNSIMLNLNFPFSYSSELDNILSTQGVYNYCTLLLNEFNYVFSADSQYTFENHYSYIRLYPLTHTINLLRRS